MPDRLTDMLRQAIHPAQVRGEEYITFRLDWVEYLIDCIDTLELNLERDEEAGETLAEMQVLYERAAPDERSQT